MQIILNGNPFSDRISCEMVSVLVVISASSLLCGHRPCLQGTTALTKPRAHLQSSRNTINRVQ